MIRMLLALLFVLFLAPCTTARGESSDAVAYTVLDDSFVALRDAFNARRDHVRLLFVVDSSCAICLRGMADLNDALLEQTDDPRLDTYVVHVPVIGGTTDHIGPSAELIHNSRVTHFWNESGRFGDQLALVADLKKGEERVYAWDVWTIYGPEVTWEGTDPPKPALLMHQLPHLSGHPTYHRLDAEAFAQDVRDRLKQLPTAPADATRP